MMMICKYLTSAQKKTGSQLYLLHNNKTSSVFKAALTVENDYY